MQKEKPVVAVIMSTYNGERYLEEQIDSILAQVGVHVELYVRDDGSRDKTKDILSKYAAEHSNIHVQYGENMGYRKSFITTLLSVPAFKYYAFSDQDDYWEKEKLISAVTKISDIDTDGVPVVYYSNLNICDEHLKAYRKTGLEKRKKTLVSILLRLSVAGCTMMMNSVLRDSIKSKTLSFDSYRYGHDGLVLSLCYALGGKIICDENAYIRYRQHGDNTSGGTNGIWQRLSKERNAFLAGKGKQTGYAGNMLLNWGEEITKESKKTLEEVAGCQKSFRNRLKIIFSPRYTTGNWKLDLLGKFKILLGYF